MKAGKKQKTFFDSTDFDFYFQYKLLGERFWFG